MEIVDAPCAGAGYAGETTVPEKLHRKWTSGESCPDNFEHLNRRICNVSIINAV